LDPPKDGGPFDVTGRLADLAALEIPPSFTLWSGGGLQAFWRISPATADLDTVEGINRALADRLGADHCWNIDRLMRLPGTVNIPDARKRARGRVPALARIAAGDDGLALDLDELINAFPPTAERRSSERGGAEDPGAVLLLTPDDLGLGPLSSIRSAIEHPPGRDRSGDLMAVVGMMVRAGYSDVQILGICLNPVNAVSAHALSQRDPRRSVLRCLEIARGDPASPGGAAGAGTQQDSRGEAADEPSLVRASDLLREPFEPRRWLVEDWFPSAQAAELRETARRVRARSHCSCAWRRRQVAPGSECQ
jgi:hypothetical protein